ncbi:hypothetical protein BDY19DRAFT_703169 [Irpex rosettiformis]|uniref:Uncharacterized protein n=1 Tax=Irpex rosettiformis TaxID=378272 RepID=A0ACB8TN05_9APHY|nr:hypothetical protein BDY19DRAFT_703169 [Irpex rosettiformis]
MSNIWRVSHKKVGDITCTEPTKISIAFFNEYTIYISTLSYVSIHPLPHPSPSRHNDHRTRPTTLSSKRRPRETPTIPFMLILPTTTTTCIRVGNDSSSGA